MKSRIPSLRSWLLAFTATATLSVQATTYDWVGTTNGAWHTATNWNGGVTPTFDNQADLKFGVNVAFTTTPSWLSTNNRTVRSLEFNSAMTIVTGSDSASNTNRTLTLEADAGNATITVTSTSTGNGIISSNGGGNVALASDLVATNDSATATLSLFQTITETGGSRSITKNGIGLLTMGNKANSFTGKVTVNGGSLRINADNRLGTPPVAPVADQLTLDGATLVTNAGSGITLNSNRGITLGAGGGTFGITSGSLSVGGTITGAGGLVKEGSNDLNLDAANNYAGSTIINQGTLRPQANGTIPSGSDLTINGGNFNPRNTIGWVYTGTITGDDLGQITLNSGTDAELAGDISGLANINANSAVTDTSISGDISGGTNVTVQNGGGAILRLSGTNTYTGTTTVAGGGTPGTLFINGDNSGATGLVTINAGGTLAGTGTIGGATTINGTHSPGTSPGVQTFTAGIDYGASSTLALDVWTNSSAPGVRGVSPLGYDGVDVTGGVLNVDPAVTGNVALNSVTGNVNFSNAFWNSSQSWPVVDIQGGASAADSNVPTLGNVTLNGSGFDSAAYGTFSFSRASGDVILNWTPSAVPTWTGTTSNSWATATNWTVAPGPGDIVRFNSTSNMMLTTTLGADYDLLGLAVINPTGPVTIGGANNLTLGAGGIDLSFATQNLFISSPIILSAAQSWNVASGRNLGIGGAVTGSGDLTLSGAGKVSLGASNILPNGAGAGNLAVNSTLDLNGTSQAINGLSGTGIVDNTAGAASVLTLGNNDATSVFTGTIQNSNGTVALIKVGTGVLTMNGANTFSGGFTNNGSGIVRPNSDTALGSGPVVSNAGQIYPTNTTVFSNTLALNNSDLRIGGGGGNTLTWNGAVTATGSSTIYADGGTGGVTLGSTLDITGVNFTSFASGGTNNIDGVISGVGGSLDVTNGTLQLSGTNTYTGATTLSGSAVFRLQSTGTITGNVIINGGGNFNVRNTVGWVYSGTISGDDTGSINLNAATDAELAGNISGISNLNAVGAGTDTTVSGNISGGTNVTVQNTGGAILRLSGNNSYSGNTNIANTGTLILESSTALPDASPVIIANGTLGAAAAGSDTAGTLDVTSTATIQLASGAALAFADSSAVDWTGGSLDITGTFVSGSSLRFGSDVNGLTVTQLGLITASGFDSFGLDASGFLTATAVGGGYSTWALTNAPSPQTPDQDFDGDGVTNGVEYVVGGTALTMDLGKLPTLSVSGGQFVFSFFRDQASIDGTTVVTIETGTTLASWPNSYSVPDGATVVNPGVTVIKGSPAGFDTVFLTVPQAPDTKKFARLKVTP